MIEFIREFVIMSEGDKLMNEVRRIRECFSRGNIVLNPSGISVVYTELPWVTQCFDVDFQNTFETFREIVNSSQYISMSINPGKSITYNFRIPDMFDDTIMYPQLTHELSLEELETIYEEMRNESEGNSDLFQFFDGADFSDDSDIADRLREFIAFDSNKHQSNVVNLPVVFRFGKLKESIQVLQRHGFPDIEISEPEFRDDIEPTGFVSICFDPDVKSITFFMDENMREFQKMCGIARSMDIEANIEDGFSSITFFA